MPPILGSAIFNIADDIRAHDEFHLALGRAFGQWALIEERLSYWFELTSGMTYPMARSMFFAPQVSQSRSALLKAAIDHDVSLSSEERAFISAATAKYGQYAAFRNQIAHGEQTFDARPNSITFKQVILIGGRDLPELAAENAVTVARLDRARERFRELAKVLMDGYETATGLTYARTINACDEDLARLPKMPDL